MPDMFCFQCQQTAGGTGCVRTGDATASVDMDVFLSKDFLLLGYFLFNKYKFYTYFIQTLNSFN